MAEYIEREAVLKDLKEELEFETTMYTAEQNKYINIDLNIGLNIAVRNVKRLPAADVVEVVRCEKCKHSKELAPHSEISPYYRHCSLWRGEETKNVWHKYKKYYADYSIVEPTDFCSYGELKELVEND